MNLYLASNNQGKISELNTLFDNAGLNIHITSASEFGGMPKIEESGSTLEENARIKALALQKIAPKDAWILADDSGLFVDTLDGAPGVRSARYAGENVSDAENNRKLLADMEDVSLDQRRARFVCCLVLLHPSIGEVVFHSICKGTIQFEPEGQYGFGYDPVFVPLGEVKTFAELGPQIKNKISHRAQALRQLIDWLKSKNTSSF